MPDGVRASPARCKEEHTRSVRYAAGEQPQDAGPGERGQQRPVRGFSATSTSDCPMGRLNPAAIHRLSARTETAVIDHFHR